LQSDSPFAFDLLQSLVTKAAVRHRNSVAFLTLRSWPADDRARAMAAFKAEKKAKTDEVLSTAASELADELRKMVGGIDKWAVASVACGHSRDAECWGKTLARRVAKVLGIPFVQVFEDRFVSGSSHPKEFKKLPPLKVKKKPQRPVIVVDDIATSGWHLEEAMLSLRDIGVSTFAAAWVSGTLGKQESAAGEDPAQRSPSDGQTDMPAPLGNRFWEARSSHGRNPIFATPDDLWAAAVEYFEWVDGNPLQEGALVTYKGFASVKALPKMRAMSIAGLCNFLDISRSTWAEYGKREGFPAIVSRIEDLIYQQKFEGSAADLLNASIIARELGLPDRQEHTGKGGGPIEKRVSIRSMSDEDLERIAAGGSD